MKNTPYPLHLFSLYIWPFSVTFSTSLSFCMHAIDSFRHFISTLLWILQCHSSKVCDLNRRLWLGLFALFCAWGFFWEWFFGFVWSVLGDPCWIYPASPLIYTSWKVAPLWGLGGLQGVALYIVVKDRSLRKLVHVVMLTLLALLWVAVVSIAQG